MISTPVAFAAHLHKNRTVAEDLGKALVKDTQDATDAIMDILDQGYRRTDGMLELLELETDYKSYVSQPVIEANTDWFLPLSDEYYWDATIEVLRNIGVSESLADSLTHRLVIECMGLVEEEGRVRPDSGIVDMFGTKALETLETFEGEADEFDQDELIALAAPRIAEWIGETIATKGEALALYATLKLIAEESD